MSAHLPVPAARRELGAAAADLNPAASRAPQPAHARRPCLERVTCLEHAAGLLAAGGGRVCCVWNTATHALHSRIVVAAPIGALSLMPDRSALAVAAGSRVSLYALPGAAPLFEYEHEAEVTSVHIGSLGQLMASADVTGRIQLRDVRSGRLMLDLKYPPGRPIVFVHRSHYLLIESQSHCTLVETGAGGSTRRFAYEPGDAAPETGPLINTTLVSHCGSVLRWFNCERYEAAFCTRDLGSVIRSIDIHDARDLVLAATEDGALHLFDLASGEPRGRHESFTCPLMFARFGPQASLYVAGGEALVMHLVRGNHARSYVDKVRPLVAMALHPGRNALLLSDRDGGITDVGLHDGRPRRPFVGPRGSVSAVACCDEWVAGGSYDGALRVWRWDGAPVASFDLGEGPVQAVLLDAQIRQAWAGSWAGRVSGFDLDTGEKRLAADCGMSSIRTLDRDAAGQRLVAGGNDGELKILDCEGHVLLSHRQPGAVYRARFLADGDVLTTAPDGVRLYRGTDLKLMRVFAGHEVRWFDLGAGRVHALSLSGELTSHDATTGELLHRTRIDVPVNHRSVVMLNPDRIVTASADGTVRVFDGRLEPVAALDLFDSGFLWQTPRRDLHPGWLHTDRPDLVEVGDLSDGGFAPWDPTDPRRARHLSVWNSASHVMPVVTGRVPAAGKPQPLRAIAGLATAAHRICFAPATVAGGVGPRA